MSFLDRQILTKDALDFLQEGQSRKQLSLIRRARAYASPNFLSYEDISKPLNLDTMVPLKVSVNENRMQYVVDLRCSKGNRKTDITKIEVPKALSSVLENMNYVETPLDFLVADNYILWDYDLLGDVDETSSSGMKGYDSDLGLYHELVLEPQGDGYTFSVKLFDKISSSYQKVTYTLSKNIDNIFELTSDNENFPCESYAFVTLSRGYNFKVSGRLTEELSSSTHKIGTVEFNASETKGFFKVRTSEDYNTVSVFRMYDAIISGRTISRGSSCDWTLTNNGRFQSESDMFTVKLNRLDSHGYIVLVYDDDDVERFVWLETVGYPVAGYDLEGSSKTYAMSTVSEDAVVTNIIGGSLVKPIGDQVVSSLTVSYASYQNVVYELDLEQETIVNETYSLIPDKTETFHVLFNSGSTKACFVDEHSVEKILSGEELNLERFFNETSRVFVTQYAINVPADVSNSYTALDCVSSGTCFHSDVRNILFEKGSIQTEDDLVTSLSDMYHLIVNGVNLDSLNLIEVSKNIDNSKETIVLQDLGSDTCYYIERALIDDTYKYLFIGTFGNTSFENSAVPIGFSVSGVYYKDLKINTRPSYTVDGVTHLVPLYKLLNYSSVLDTSTEDAEDVSIQNCILSIGEDEIVGSLKVQDTSSSLFSDCALCLKEIPIIFNKVNGFHIVSDTGEVKSLSGELNTGHKLMVEQEDWCFYTPLMLSVKDFYNVGTDSSVQYITSNTSRLLDAENHIGIRTVVLVCDVLETLGNGYTRCTEIPFAVLTNAEFIRSYMLEIHIIETNNFWRVESDECTCDDSRNTEVKDLSQVPMSLRGVYTNLKDNLWILFNSESVTCSELKVSLAGVLEFSYRERQYALPIDSLLSGSSSLFREDGSYLIIFDETESIVNGEDSLPKNVSLSDGEAITTTIQASIPITYAFVDFIGYGNLSVPMIGQPYNTSQTMQCVTPWHTVKLSDKEKHFIILDVSHIVNWFISANADALCSFSANILNVEKTKRVSHTYISSYV